MTAGVVSGLQYVKIKAIKIRPPYSTTRHLTFSVCQLKWKCPLSFAKRFLVGYQLDLSMLLLNP